MDYKEIFKKYWFVIAVGVLLFAFVISWAASSNDNKKEEETEEGIAPTATIKQVDGKYVLFDIDGANEYYADDYYDVIDKTSETSIVLNDLLTIISGKEIKMTEEIRTEAANAAAYQIANYSEEQVEQLMRTNGLKRYGNITKYFEDVYRNQELIEVYMKNHENDTVADYLAATPVHKISHILIKVADVTEETDENGNVTHTANPTAEENEKLNTVLEELKTKTFAEVAIQYSEDGSAQDGGILGFQTSEEAASQYVPEFAEYIQNPKYDEVSDVITTQYGYHIILVENPKVDDPDFINYYLSANNSGNYIDMLAEYCNKLNIEIIDQNLIDLFNEIGTVKLNGQEEVKEETAEQTTDETAIEESEASE